MTIRLLDYADLQQRGVKYSKCQLWRLWKEGKFPKPVKLSAVRNAWRADEIDAWIKARIAERDGTRA
jgi:predicted DNA-binding transcriptional regulator AlpA